jgi:hypothetical protein
MYDEPHKDDLNYEAYWASRPLDELLEKASQASEKAYSGSMGILTFLEWALDHLEPGSEMGADIVDVMDKTSRINRMLAELRQDLARLMQGATDE